jgi:hypothetical protein
MVRRLARSCGACSQAYATPDAGARPARYGRLLLSVSGATWLDVSGDGGRTWSTALSFDDGGLGWSDFGFTTPTEGVAIYGTWGTAAACT